MKSSNISRFAAPRRIFDTVLIRLVGFVWAPSPRRGHGPPLASPVICPLYEPSIFRSSWNPYTIFFNLIMFCPRRYCSLPICETGFPVLSRVRPAYSVSGAGELVFSLRFDRTPLRNRKGHNMDSKRLDESQSIELMLEMSLARSGTMRLGVAFS